MHTEPAGTAATTATLAHFRVEVRQLQLVRRHFGDRADVGILALHLHPQRAQEARLPEVESAQRMAARPAVVADHQHGGAAPRIADIAADARQRKRDQAVPGNKISI
jgi:hypothetical protein